MIYIGPIVKRVLTDILIKYLKAKQEQLVAALKKALNHDIVLDFDITETKEECWFTVEITMIMTVEEEFIDYKVGRISVDENGLDIYGYTKTLENILKEVL